MFLIHIGTLLQHPDLLRVSLVMYFMFIYFILVPINLVLENISLYFILSLKWFSILLLITWYVILTLNVCILYRMKRKARTPVFRSWHHLTVQ